MYELRIIEFQVPFRFRCWVILYVSIFECPPTLDFDLSFNCHVGMRFKVLCVHVLYFLHVDIIESFDSCDNKDIEMCRYDVGISFKFDLEGHLNFHLKM